MKTKETIAIIGATGNMGASIARNLSKHSYRLVLMSKDAEKLSALKDSLSSPDTKATIDSNDCAKEVSWEADIIIMACPSEAENEIAERIREVATGKIVISISNPLGVHYKDRVTSQDTSAAEKLQKLLPHSKVVKTFNTALPADSSSPGSDHKGVDSFIASNSAHALEVAAKIVTAAGFNPVVVGDLSASRTLERVRLKLIHVALKSNYNWYAGWNILHN